jgi:hypothetical protein
VSELTRLGDTQTFSVTLLDALVRSGEELSAAVDQLPNAYLCALADRMNLSPAQSMSQMRTVVKRRLVGAGGLVRESRAK